MSSQKSEVDAAKPELHPTRGKTDYQEDFAGVFQAELEELQARRKACALPVPSPQEAGSGPSARLGLVGLALSGGGIRSASFSLGVVQALAGGDSDKGYLERIDYLSTVSGGGYLGACLSSLLGDKDAKALEPTRFPLRKQSGEQETPELSHLRNGSNYLSPPGPLNALGLPTLVVRGVLLTFVALLPMIYVAVLLTGLLYEVVDLRLRLEGRNLHGLVDTYWHWGVGGSAALFAALGALFPFAMRLHPNMKQRGLYLKAMTVVLKLTLVLLVLRPTLWLVDWAAYMTFKELGLMAGELWMELRPKQLMTWVTLGSALAGIVGVVARWPRVLRVLGLGLAAVAGPLIIFATYLALCIWQVHPARRYKVVGEELEPQKMTSARKDELLTQEKALRLAELPRYVPGNGSPRKMLEIEGTGRKLQIESFEGEEKKPQWWERPQYEGWKDAATRTRVKELLGEQKLAGESVHFAWEMPEGKAGDTGRMLLVWGNMWNVEGLLLLLLWGPSFFINAHFLNINYTSPHGFYRDQLSRVFLRKWNKERKDEEPEFNDRLKLSALRTRPGQESSAAPYHLINATVNLSEAQDLRGRHGDFFLFSKHYVGGEKTGWLRTKQVEKLEPHLDLGTAMAISAAAASPNMGLFTSWALSFLLMMLNVRLGYWLPNPRAVHKTKEGMRRRWLFMGPGPRYLWKEALRRFRPDDDYVNVSDGGHIENLGVYELLRRRCRLIIAVDGEADPKMGFNGLGTLVRFARIDLGVTIELEDLEALRKVEGYSKAHWALGTIHYGKGEQGTLLYLKSSLTGDEAADLRAYHAANPDFPHESTADQFFSEAQFEVYRALGQHIAEEPRLREKLEEVLEQLHGEGTAQGAVAVEIREAG